MLETIREYAGERLDDLARERCRDRHAAFYCAFVEQSRDELGDLSRQGVVTRLESELPNLRESLSWFRATERHAQELRMLRALGKFWLSRDHLAEGETILTEALARIPEDGSNLRLRVALDLGEILLRRGKPREARPSVEQWIDTARADGDMSELAFALATLASISMREADFATSVALLEEALEIARPIGDGKLRAYVVGNLGYALSGVGRFEQAAESCRESLELAPAAADSSVDRANLGLALLGLGDIEGAAGQYRLALEHSLESGFFFSVADALVGAAAVALDRGRHGAALAVLAGAGAMRSEFGLSPEPLEHDLSQRVSAAARSALPSDVAQRAWREGGRLTADEAVGYALASID